MGPLVEAVELDVRAPGEEDEKEAAGEKDQDAGEHALRHAEHEAFDGLIRGDERVKICMELCIHDICRDIT